MLFFTLILFVFFLSFVPGWGKDAERIIFRCKKLRIRLLSGVYVLPLDCLGLRLAVKVWVRLGGR